MMESAKLKVYVVDDEQGMRMGVQRALESHTVTLADLGEEVRFDITGFDSAESVQKALKTAPPDLLLLDNKLPGKSGAMLLDELAREKTAICTIMITAYATLDNIIQTIKLGAFDFLPKPFTPDELRYAISKAARDVVLTQKARKLAQEKKRIRFEFITVLAHELKAPLNAVESYVDIIKNKRAGEKLEDYGLMMERMMVRIQGMRKLILDLLDLTAIESGEKERKITTVDLARAARKIKDELWEEAASRNIRLQTAPEEPIPFEADPEDMDLILRNLISNAIKYNRLDGRVDVQLALENGAAVIRVSDTGIGIRAEDQVGLFKEFVRVKNEQTQLIPGSGLGLSIVKKVSLLYDGNVSVQSDGASGTTFTVTLKPR